MATLAARLGRVRVAEYLPGRRRWAATAAALALSSSAPLRHSSVGMSSSWKPAPWHFSSPGSPCSLSSETATRNPARKPGIGRQIGITPARSSSECGSMNLISSSRLANRARRLGFAASGIRSPPERPTCRQRSGNQTIGRPCCGAKGGLIVSGAATGSLLWSHV